MLLLRSKMDINPIVWQDTREGFLRNRTITVCDKALDAIGKIETEKLVEQSSKYEKMYKTIKTIKT